ncbi:3'5'-cyclic nucleotide phosphodiesterase, catalytic domain protein [Metarhizium rileyi]|uniref:Phosphodiesterase n=1 Tax=Metarhizium rileyi (strain RCEF 4871) TaxID=1649241 RepID=A0A167E091_METRR|nr:3'5'-cyclic nucleotide phosphodiesterase, catalytic domain protein [Metarhizium rileyi RCEF 4871]
MDRLLCNVIYVNRTAGEDRLLRAAPDANQIAHESEWKRDQAKELVQPLLDTFGHVYVCGTGASCLSTLLQLQEGSMTNITPTLVLLDTPFDDHIQDQHTRPRSSSPTSAPATQTAEIYTPNEELYGLGLLQKIMTEAHLRNMSKLVVPVAIISHPDTTVPNGGRQMTDGASEVDQGQQATLASNRQLMRTCLDLGAVDVLMSPLNSKSITTLEICAYRAHRDAAKEQQALMAVAKGRKRSWVGISEQKPFAYLREAMVSGLMNGICRLDSNEGQITGAHIAVSSGRQCEIADAVGRWHFCAHSFSDDELLVAALIMFKHALAEPELEPWRIPADQLINYLVACRAAYNSFVPYHNFRHVVDVLQATFNFLVHIGALAPYPANRQQGTVQEKSPIAALLSPFEALTLLITAIGHDVGHPGVNNGFLATLNAPLAQLYNDRSVLESFHCAAYSQILRRYWPSAFEDRKMRSLMISSILATDMGLHFDYMKKLGDIQEKLQDNNNTDGWNGRQLEDHKALACSLLIKCADISNVARHHDTALQWMHILSEEFSRQASMEEELDIKSSLMAQPKKDILSLSNAQLGFMNMFAIPLFQGVADIMPAMRYTIGELEINKRLFEDKVQEEKSRQSPDASKLRRGAREGTFSPQTRSCAGDTNTQEGQQPAGQVEPVSKKMTDGTTEEKEDAPQVVADVVNRLAQQAPIASEEPADIAVKVAITALRQDLVGTTSTFDAVRELAESDPFNCRLRGNSGTESKSSTHFGRQRCSETTDGSTSGALAGDWQSQATTATTGKMALSPSTQGTSIVSNESVERTLSATGMNISPPSASSQGSPGTVLRDAGAADDDLDHGGSVSKAEGKALRKKTSRFRMKDFPFFRRNKASSPSLPASDTTS